MSLNPERQTTACNFSTRKKASYLERILLYIKGMGLGVFTQLNNMGRKSRRGRILFNIQNEKV